MQMDHKQSKPCESLRQGLEHTISDLLKANDAACLNMQQKPTDSNEQMSRLYHQVRPCEVWGCNHRYNICNANKKHCRNFCLEVSHIMGR